MKTKAEIINELMQEVDKKMCLDSPKEATIYRKILEKALSIQEKEFLEIIKKFETGRITLDEMIKELKSAVEGK